MELTSYLCKHINCSLFHHVVLLRIGIDGIVERWRVSGAGNIMSLPSMNCSEFNESQLGTRWLSMFESPLCCDSLCLRWQMSNKWRWIVNSIPGQLYLLVSVSPNQLTWETMNFLAKWNIACFLGHRFRPLPCPLWSKSGVNSTSLTVRALLIKLTVNHMPIFNSTSNGSLKLNKSHGLLIAFLNYVRTIFTFWFLGTWLHTFWSQG